MAGAAPLNLRSEKKNSLFFSMSKCVSLLCNCVLSFQMTDYLTLSTLCHKHSVCAYDTVSDELCVCMLNCLKNLLSSLLNLSVRHAVHVGLTTDPNGDNNNQTSFRS